MPSSNTVPFRCATSPRLCERLEVEMMSIACSCDKQIRDEGCITQALFPRADIDDLMRATLIIDSARGTHRTGLRIVASARVSKCHDHKSLDVHRDGVLKLHDLDVQSGEPEEPFLSLQLLRIITISYCSFRPPLQPASACTCMHRSDRCTFIFRSRIDRL